MSTDLIDALAPIPDRVRAGVDLLDREAPGWVDHIDLDALDISSEFWCVLGQLFDDRRSDGYTEGLDELGIEGKANLYGFCGAFVGDEAHEDERRLTYAWRNRIDARRVTA